MIGIYFKEFLMVKSAAMALIGTLVLSSCGDVNYTGNRSSADESNENELNIVHYGLFQDATEGNPSQIYLFTQDPKPGKRKLMMGSKCQDGDQFTISKTQVSVNVRAQGIEILESVEAETTENGIQCSFSLKPGFLKLQATGDSYQLVRSKIDNMPMKRTTWDEFSSAASN